VTGIIQLILPTMDRNHTEPDYESPAFLKNILIQNDLLDVWRVRNVKVKQYTWIKVSQERISAARLDRFYVCKKTNNRIVAANIVPVCFSDHHFVTCNLTLSQTQCKSPYWKLNVRLLQEKDFFERFNFFLGVLGFSERGIRKFNSVVGIG